MVSIAAFQAVDPGSIPGRRIPFLLIIGIFGLKIITFVYSIVLQ